MTALPRAVRAAAVAALAALLAPSLARAQEEKEPSPEDIKKKVLEVERLMRGAEESLSRSTDTRTSEERAAEAARKMLESLTKAETGKSPEDLRKEAEGGSKEAAETLEKLTKRATEETKKAAETMRALAGGGASSEEAGKRVREVIEKVKGEGGGASQGIRWILEKAVKRSGNQGGGGGSNQEPEKQPNSEPPESSSGTPENPKGSKDQSNDPAQKPPDKSEPPSNPDVTAWLTELPNQIRKAYESQDWDSIPPKWREVLKDWTKKMADDLEKKRR